MTAAGTAIAGVGATEYWPRGGSGERTRIELACDAIKAAVADAGLAVDDIDGFALFAGGLDVALLAQTLGIPELRFSAVVSGSGGGSAASIGLAAAAIESRQASVVVSVVSMKQVGAQRMSQYYAGEAQSSADDFYRAGGLLAPGPMFALIARRHMHEYGTTRRAFGEVAMAARQHASTRPAALRRSPLTMERYLDAPMLSDPLCRYDYCLESDGAVAVITTSADRARDLRHRPVRIMASASGGSGSWGKAMEWMGMPDRLFTTAGHSSLAPRLFGDAGLTPADVDVALLFDHFTPMVILQLEDYGFCKPGEGGDFVLDGHIRWPSGGLPVNPHGGNLAEAYLLGLTHVREAVEQLRGAAVNQVPGAQVALVTGGPAYLPVSSLLLAR